MVKRGTQPEQAESPAPVFEPAASLHGLIEQQVLLSPDLIAVQMDADQLSYRQLDAAANRLAHYLRELGVGPDVVVGVCMERCLALPVALLAILKAGGAYLPLDPDTPDARLEFVIEDADVALLLIQAQWTVPTFYQGLAVALDAENAFLDSYPESAPVSQTGADHLAYVIYTSGSTGQPKGCMLPHQAVCNRLQWMQAEYSLRPGHRVLQKTPVTFDVSVWELFWPLIVGATLVMAAPRGHKDSHYLAQVIREHRISHCHFVPSMLRFFLNYPTVRSCTGLEDVFVSGEALPRTLMEAFLDTLQARLHNLYGPTEAAVDVSHWQCHRRSDGKVPIGRAISNVQLLVLNDALQAVDDGAEGELFIGGVALARGYLNREELTAERFITGPGGQRLYRTGDRVCRLADGNIEYLGRADFHVKLRGLRIELGEIETHLREHPAVREAAVLVRGEDDPLLVAYLETADETLNLKAVREFLASKLPDYMLPSRVLGMSSLPVTVHGKLDRGALPWPLHDRRPETEKTSASVPKQDERVNALRREMEQCIAAYMANALDQSEVDPEADLFDLGATSLTLVRLFEWIRDQYGVTVAVDDFLDMPTVRFVASVLVSGRKTSDSQEMTESSAPVTPSIITLKPMPLPTLQAGERTPGPLTLAELGEWLGQLAAGLDENGTLRYLYPSAGGLNAVRDYVSISEGSINGVPAGGYYYHPEFHALHRVGNGDTGWNIDFGIFLVAALDAITPVYQGLGLELARLEAGYMARLLEDSAFVMGLPVKQVQDLAALPRTAFSSLHDECFLHALVERSGARNAPLAPTAGSPVDSVPTRIPASLDMANMDPAAVELLHEEKRHLRAPGVGGVSLSLPGKSFPWHAYRKRACHRSYLDDAISQQDMGGLLAAAEIAGTGLGMYVFVRDGGVEGMQEGVFRYDPVQHALHYQGPLSSEQFARVWTPFNRRHGRAAAFALFMVTEGSISSREQIQAGNSGQRLMQLQSVMGMGLCPIGGLRFELVASAAGLPEGVRLVHSFVGGRVPRAQQDNQGIQRADRAENMDIAIVGVSGRYPDAPTPQVLWRNVERGHRTV